MTVICIWWAPRSGKTTLARRLHEELNIPYVPWDYLKCIVNQYTKEEMKKVVPIFAESMSNDERYEKFSPERMKEEYLASAHHCRKGFWAFIQCAIGDGYDFIIEGYQILPELIYKEFKDVSEVIPIFLGKENPEEIYDWVKISEDPNDWLKNKCRDETIVKASEMIALLSWEFKREAEAFGYRYVSTEKNFLQTIDWLVAEVKARI